jgi:ferritin
MIAKRMELEINKQINAELWSAYLYLSMTAYFEKKGLPGCANWMRIQYQEEVAHALKFFDYICDRGGEVKLMPIAEVPTDWKNIIEVFEQTLKHEEIVTSLINNLMDVAIEEKDHASKSFLQWYLDEQVEEEMNVNKILDQLRLIDGKGEGLLMLDREFAARVFVDPTKPQA